MKKVLELNRRCYRCLEKAPDVFQHLESKYSMVIKLFEKVSRCYIQVHGKDEQFERGLRELEDILLELKKKEEETYSIHEGQLEKFRNEHPEINFSEVALLEGEKKSSSIRVSAFGRRFDLLYFERKVFEKVEDVLSPSCDGNEVGVIITGKAGHGKSTLVNLLTKCEMKTGVGRPVTNFEELMRKDIEEFRHPKLPIYFFDTVGLNSFDSTEKIIQNLNNHYEFIYRNGKHINYFFYLFEGSCSRWDKDYTSGIINGSRKWFKESNLDPPAFFVVISKCDNVSERRFEYFKRLIREDFGSDVQVFAVSDQSRRGNFSFPRFCPNKECMDDPIPLDNYFAEYKCRNCSQTFKGCPFCANPNLKRADNEKWVCYHCKEKFENFSQKNETDELISKLIELSFEEGKNQWIELRKKMNETGLETMTQEESEGELENSSQKYHQRLEAYGEKYGNIQRKRTSLLRSLATSANTRLTVSCGIVLAHSGLCGVVGASALPITDAFIIIPLQIAMITEIAAIWEIRFEKGVILTMIKDVTLKVLESVSRSVTGYGLVVGGICLSVASFSKFFLGGGTILGGMVCGSVAALGTAIVGVIGTVIAFEGFKEGRSVVEDVSVDSFNVHEVKENLVHVLDEAKAFHEKNRKMKNLVMGILDGIKKLKK